MVNILGFVGHIVSIKITYFYNSRKSAVDEHRQTKGCSCVKKKKSTKTDDSLVGQSLQIPDLDNEQVILLSMSPNIRSFYTRNETGNRGFVCLAPKYDSSHH